MTQWITAEGLIDVTFRKHRWVHIDNDTDEVFFLEKGTEVTTLAPVTQELTVEELNQLTVDQLKLKWKNWTSVQRNSLQN